MTEWTVKQRKQHAGLFNAHNKTVIRRLHVMHTASGNTKSFAAMSQQSSMLAVQMGTTENAS